MAKIIIRKLNLLMTKAGGKTSFDMVALQKISLFSKKTKTEKQLIRELLVQVRGHHSSPEVPYPRDRQGRHHCGRYSCPPRAPPHCAG
jgi:hypothetical protein